ncbi:MAG TPA: CpsD/CapB family tyrosine-protein kinase [Myxococcota bacterium]|nr:CpsD/CapB family tyrosine-protein kinase [Myxococcota bacterium]
MAKIYDALRKAEADRKQKLGERSKRHALLDAEPLAPSGERGEPTRKPGWTLGGGSAQRRASDASAELNKRRITLLQPESFIAEQFRALRGRIDAIASQRPIKTLAITSAFPGEGKTTCAINLAIVTSMSLGRRVLLIDCDLRRPKVHPALGLKPTAGLAEVLTGACSIDQAITPAQGIALDVLPVCARPANPSELLGSPEMSRLIEAVSQRYDRIILDTPAALGLPDAKAVSDLCDGMVVVVRADMTARSDIEAVLEIFERERVLGLMINGVDANQGRYGYTS